MNTETCDDARLTLGNPGADELARRRASAHQSRCVACSSTNDLDRHLQQLLGKIEMPTPGTTLLANRPLLSKPTRILLAVAALVQATVAGPWLLGVNQFSSLLGRATPEHLTRDGALGMVVAVAGAITVWRARYSFAMLGLCAAVVLMQTLGTLVDGHDGDVGISFEKVHVIALAIVGLVVLTAMRRERVPGPLGAGSRLIAPNACRADTHDRRVWRNRDRFDGQRVNHGIGVSDVVASNKAIHAELLDIVNLRRQ